MSDRSPLTRLGYTFNSSTFRWEIRDEEGKVVSFISDEAVIKSGEEDIAREIAKQFGAKLEWYE
jgi:hypothetical protein